MKPRPLEILLVEDSATDLEIIREIFDEIQDDVRPVRLRVVRDGDEAIATLRGMIGPAVRPDLILLDINMPKKNGFEVLREIKSDVALRHLPVLMLTTSSRPEDISEAYACGAASYIVKPLKMKEFREVLRKLVVYWTTVSSFPVFPEDPLGAGPDRRGAAEKGLTLVELLVVTVIIGIISAFAVVKIGNAINRAKKAALVTYMVSDFRQAMREYYFDHQGYPVGAGPVDPTVTLKAEGYLTNTISEKTAGLNVSVSGVYYSSVTVGLPGIGGFSIGAADYWYAWCMLPPASNSLELPCVKVTETTFKESALLLTP